MTRSQLIATCLSGAEGDRLARNRCADRIATELNRLYPPEQPNAAPSCLAAPNLSLRAVTDQLMLAVQAEADIHERADEDSAITIAALALARFPCGTRRF